MTDAEIENELQGIMRDVLMHDDLVLRPDMTAADVEGWDSFKMVEIVMAMEQHFGIKVGSRQLDSLQNVGDLVAIVRAQRGAPAATAVA